MARKSSSSGIGAIIALVILVAVISRFIDRIKENPMPFIIICVIVAGVICMVISRRSRARLKAEYARQDELAEKANSSKPSNDVEAVQPSTLSNTPSAEPVKQAIVNTIEEKPECESEKEEVEFRLPDTIDGATVAYTYEKVVFKLTLVDDPDPFIAKPLEFEKKTDKIHVVCEDTEIGYLKSGKITDMVRDWLDRGDPLRAFLTAYDTDDATGEFIIVFYRDALKHAKRRGVAHKEYKLTGNKSAAIQEECYLASVGDRCEIEYDYDKEKYAVRDETYTLFGYLPAAGQKFYEEHDCDCIAVVTNVEYDDEDRTVIYVELYAS